MMRLKSFWAQIWSKFLRHVADESLLRKGDKVLMAVSGGPDSVCLARLLSQLQNDWRLKLHILHVHHGLRGKRADADARFVQNLARRMNVPCAVVRVQTAKLAEKERRSLEDAARKLRYRALERAAARLGFSVVATGHTLDDQAETVLLHLLRGTEPRGLGGIPPKRKLGKAVLIRPLLTLSRRDILETLKVFQLASRRDETNLSERFTRNWVRRKVIPLLETKNPRLKERLAKMSARMREISPPKAG
ncbi:MAG: tRNA lysidine(34) synthetase TilS [Elusimicrobia bacterium RIFCSPLOWO2_12_FULL_59_9]|nr:MAG: tRNA lysidine(34) synthetase TilS [Elusimicrobia bacterium RIFCSPLOWO2_12_FULL_59_9]